jgi:hypothetical protein
MKHPHCSYYMILYYATNRSTTSLYCQIKLRNVLWTTRSPQGTSANYLQYQVAAVSQIAQQ